MLPGRAWPTGSTGLGFVVERGVVPDDPAAIEGALVDGAARHSARRDDRWHRPDPAGRDAAGHAGDPRLRGPRPGRGDARGRPCRDAAGRPVARRRRRSRPLVDRQPAGQPQGRAGVARGHRSRCSSTRSRPSPGRSITTRARALAPKPTEPRRSADVRAVRRGPGLPAGLPGVLGRGGLLRPGHGPPPARLRRGPAVAPVRGTCRPASSAWSSTRSSRRRCSRTPGPG